MTRAQILLTEYGASHRNPTNEKIHFVCVPAIYWSVLAVLWTLPFPGSLAIGPLPVNWALIAVILVQIYYFSLATRLAIGALIINLLLLGVTWLVARHTPLPLWQIAIAVFIIAWIGQFIGHHIEGKRPSFFKDLQFLLIGPFWLLSLVYRKFGWKP